MKVQRQIAKNRVVLALPVALLMATNAWSAKKDTDYIDENGVSAKMNCTLIDASLLSTATLNNSASCFVVEDTLEYNGHLRLTNDNVTFIIADKAKFTINYNSSDNSTHAMDGRQGRGRDRGS